MKKTILGFCILGVWAASLLFTGCASGPPLKMETVAMAPTLPVGSTFAVDPNAFRDRDPQRFELVLFRYDARELNPPIQQPTDGASIVYRVVGLPGELIEITEDEVLINGNPMPPLAGIRFEPAPESTQYQRFNRIRLPEGSYFVMGDNSRKALDSRYWGTIRRDQIQGKVVPRTG